jgi:hypothetical protein
MADEKKTEDKQSTDEKKSEEEINEIAKKLGEELTFGSSLGRYWFVYMLATVGGAGLGAVIGWNTSRLLELADWLGLSIGGGAGALLGFGAAAGATRQLDKNQVAAINTFAIEAEKEMKAQGDSLRGEISELQSEIGNLRSSLKEQLLEDLEPEIESVREDVEAIGTQINKVPVPRKKPAAKKAAPAKTATKNKKTVAKKGRKKAA